MPYLLIDLAVGENPAPLLYQKAQNLIFYGSQPHAPALHRDLPLGVVNDQTVHPIDPIDIGAHVHQLGISAQLGLDSGQQLQRIAVRYHIIVSPCLQRHDLRRLRRLGRDHDQRNAAPAAKPRYHLDPLVPALIVQLHIHQHQVDLRLFQQIVQLLQVSRQQHGKPFPNEQRRHLFRDSRLIIVD